MFIPWEHSTFQVESQGFLGSPCGIHSHKCWNLSGCYYKYHSTWTPGNPWESTRNWWGRVKSSFLEPWEVRGLSHNPMDPLRIHSEFHDLKWLWYSQIFQSDLVFPTRSKSDQIPSGIRADLTISEQNLSPWYSSPYLEIVNTRYHGNFPKKEIYIENLHRTLNMIKLY